MSFILPGVNFLTDDGCVERKGFRRDRLLAFMEERNLNVASLARLLGLSRPAVSQWVNGHTSPAGESLARLVRVSGYPTSYWYPEGEEVESTPKAVGHEDVLPAAAMREPTTPDRDELPPLDRPVTRRELEEILRKYGLEPKET